MSKPTSVILLCEDNLTAVLIRSYLKRCGIEHGIRVNLSRAGSGFDWVIRQYPIQVNAYRLAKARIGVWLIVVIDADTGTVERRLNQLSASMRGCGIRELEGYRVEDEMLARLVPRRNIETWILCLTGTEVNETDDYSNSRRKDVWHELAGPAALQLHDWTRPNTEPPARCIESLGLGVSQLRRLELNRRARS
jgi:hypothetical protein